MTQKVILYTGMLTTLSLCLFVYIKIFTPKDAGTMINTPEASYSSPNTPTFLANSPTFLTIFGVYFSSSALLFTFYILILVYYKNGIR